MTGFVDNAIRSVGGALLLVVAALSQQEQQPEPTPEPPEKVEVVEAAEMAAPAPPAGNIVQDVEDLKERVSRLEDQISPSADDPAEAEHASAQFEGDLLRAQLAGRPLLLFAWNPDNTSHNERLKKACEGVEGIRERFVSTRYNLSDRWDATQTVAERFKLGTARTSLVIVDPDSRRFVRVQKLEDLK